MRLRHRRALRRDLIAFAGDRVGRLSGGVELRHQQLLPVDHDAGADLGDVRRVVEHSVRLWRPVVVRPCSFFGIGAYTVTLALVYWNLTPWLGIPLGMIVAAVAAVLIGLPTFRLRGHYFALSMLAYPLAILYFLQYLGFQEMSLPMHRENPAAFLEFTNPHNYTLVAVGIADRGVVVCMLVENSRFGLALLAIRQNELAAEAAGINAGCGRCERWWCPA